MKPWQKHARAVVIGTSLLTLAACNNETTLDWDMRNPGTGLSTTAASRQPSAPRPTADDRGVITYPNYQVVVARRYDTVRSVADRIGVSAAELASYNAVQPDTNLRSGEVLALPRRISGTSSAIQPGGAIDITTIASGAIDRADANAPRAAAPATPQAEPLRHKVIRGETAYSIARLYNVSTRSLAEWNGLGSDLGVREGQYLLIPVAAADAPAGRPFAEPAPGTGSPTPEPPSARTPLPAERTVAAGAKASGTPASPDLGAGRTAASASALAMPADGKIIRGYVKKKNEGIDIAAAAGSPVRAAANGTVAAITKDTEQVPIIVIRHDDNLLTVYANIDGIKVAKGDTVKRGQTIAVVRAANPAFLHFEVRKGFDSVDPVPYLQ